jgi:hypothetical protein
MSCEGTHVGQSAGPPPRLRRPGRTLAGWLLLAPIAALMVFYAYVATLVVNPHVDEAYTRTFLTREFQLYPTADGWKPGDGLDYVVGTYVDFHRHDMRRWLGRLGWQRFDTPTVTLRAISAGIYLHLVGEADPGLKRHKLTIALICRLPLYHAGEIEVIVNGHAAGSADCGEGAVTIEADLPAGSLGVHTYDTIEIARDEGSVFERIATRLGLRAQAVELAAMAVDAQ